MDNAILKYEQLPPLEKKEVADFIDFLFTKLRKPKSDSSNTKKREFPESVWSEEDLKIFEENRKLFNQWEPPTW